MEGLGVTHSMVHIKGPYAYGNMVVDMRHVINNTIYELPHLNALT